MTIVTLARVAHVAAGATALLALPLPMLDRKGGPLHRRAGQVYTAAMGVVALTGAVMCAGALTDGNPANDDFAVFLFFIAVLSASAASMGVRVLRTKNRRAPNHNPWDLGLATGLLAAAVVVLGLGFLRASTLFLVFGAGGVARAALQLRFWLRAPESRLGSVLEHVSAMGTASIGTVTAFLVVNAPRLHLGHATLAVWIVPGILGGAGIMLARRRHAGGKPTPAHVAT